MGKWAGIGLCDDRFVLNDSKTLGTQKHGVNLGYFYQNTGINRLQMHGEVSKDEIQPLVVGDLLDVRVDFSTNRVYFFHNEKLQGYLAPTQNSLKEGKLYPCIDMAVGTEIGNIHTYHGP